MVSAETNFVRYDMELEHVKSIEGSPRPSDIFEPHMPGIDLLSDMDALFSMARSQRAEDGSSIEKGGNGQRSVAIVTPGRILMYEPCPPPGSMSDLQVAPMKKLMPPEPPLNISAISYTFLEAFLEDETKTKCIPFLGFLVGFAYIGHSVIVFEGHPSAFESGARNSDVLIVDSGMLPFIQSDWVEAAHKVMSPGAKIFVHNRETFTLMRVARSSNAQGWQYSEDDGEASYANCLLTTLAKGTSLSAQVASGQALPNLADLTTDPKELDWIAGLPFKYDELDADKVIKIILHAAGWRWYHIFKTKGVLRARLATEHEELKPVSFTLTLTKNTEGRRQLRIER